MTRLYRGRIFLAETPFGGSSRKERLVLAVSEPSARGEIELLPVAEGSEAAPDILALPREAFEGRPPYRSLVLSLRGGFAAPAARIRRKTAQVTRAFLETALRRRALLAARDHYEVMHAPAKAEFSPGDRIPYAARVFDAGEIECLVDASLEFWLTAGRYAGRFEREMARYLGVRHCSLTNSGSSANLLAFMALTSPKLGERRIRKGDEVITTAVAFPTTVAPIVQYGAVPVFVDVALPTYNVDCADLERALSPRTKAVFLAHTLGNPFDAAAVRAFCDRHGLWLIEDNCDSLGARVLLDGRWRMTGSVGHLATSSFYPPHHMTMGEGGAVYTDDTALKRLVESFRDWGRDCWCPPGHDNTCGNRFAQQFGELPFGYDHKYVFSHFGFNLKVTDLQAAVGCAQLEKLPGFVAARRKNWEALRDGVAGLSDVFILPEATRDSDPSWFGFLLTVREDAPFRRDDIVARLEKHGIQTRTLFAGNLIKHPCFDEMRSSGDGYRVVGKLPNTDIVMNRAFWIGVYPGLSEAETRYMAERIRKFARARR